MLGFLKKTFKKQPSMDVKDSAGGSSEDAAEDRGKDRIRTRVIESVKITQRDKRDKLFSSRRDLTSGDADEPQSHAANSTYLVNDKGATTVGQKSMTKSCSVGAALSKLTTKAESNRRKLLEEWRKKKEQSRPVTNKPVFKVHHVDENLFSKNTQMPSSASFNFHMKVDLSTATMTNQRKYQSASSLNHASSSCGYTSHVPSHIVSKPVTRSQSKLEIKSTTIANHDSKTTTSAAPKTTRGPLPSRSASSLTDAKRPIVETKKTLAAGVGVKKATQVSKTTLTAAPQPVHNSTIHDPAVEDISNKMDSAVVITSKAASKNSLTLTAQLPQIKLTSPIVETVTSSEPVMAVVRAPSPIPTPKSPSPPPAITINEPVIDSAYFESIDLDKRDVAYYKSLLEFKTRLLNSFCEQWEAICGEAPDDVQGDVRSACGLAKLLIDERFNQFSDLIRQCESSQSATQSTDSVSSLLVKCSDLQGYWDMVEYQVQDVLLRFEYLQKLKECGYEKTPELSEYFEKKMTANKPKELDHRRPAEPRNRPARTYFKKKQQNAEVVKPATEETKPTEEAEAAATTTSSAGNTKTGAVAAKSAKSRFAQFRAAKMQQQQQSGHAESDIAIEIVMPTPTKQAAALPKTPAHEQVLADVGNSVETSATSKSASKSTRRTRKSNVTPVAEPKRYNLRSRPSDLIKFDSPVRQSLIPGGATLAPPPRKSIMPSNLLPTTMEEEANTTIKHDPFSSPRVQLRQEEENKENNEAAAQVDYFGEEDTFGRPNYDVVNMKLRASIAPTTSSFTPQRRISVMRESLEPDRIINLSRSPLLKLALISSHSKRLSTSRPTDFPNF